MIIMMHMQVIKNEEIMLPRTRNMLNFGYLILEKGFKKMDIVPTKKVTIETIKIMAFSSITPVYTGPSL